ncbi:MAG: polysaccharide biosynthesis protein [Rhodobacteraceae bacterium]|nr:MAG: polysaccharide biosynthesis protein [Paracoccaceae bacterium]
MTQAENTAPTLIARLLRGAAFTSGGFVISQALRFGSNLILTRLLFPEAFGLMALVTMILMGLALLSDTGVQQSIMQHARGDEPDFLNTAWTLNLARGVLLWLLACALAWPAAALYSAPDLITILPVAAFALVLLGLSPTRVFTAQRHLLLGRIMGIELAAQVVGIALMIWLAWLTNSVWALVWGSLATAVLKLALDWTLLPGPANRLRWEPRAARELLHFGGWILLASAFGFLLTQGDRAILGVYLSIEALGVYNIAWFLASFPILLTNALVARLLIPAYRESAAAANPALDARIRRLRIYLTGGVGLMLIALALIGPWLVAWLYDPRYADAGPIMVMIAAASLPPLVTITYDQAALARGDSRRFFLMIAARAAIQTTLFILGVLLAGLPGALLGQALSGLMIYPLIAYHARKMRVWHKAHDLGFMLAALITAAGVATVHSDAIISMITINSAAAY